jgi:hypothetical protein
MQFKIVFLKDFFVVFYGRKLIYLIPKKDLACRPLSNIKYKRIKKFGELKINGKMIFQKI